MNDEIDAEFKRMHPVDVYINTFRVKQLLRKHTDDESRDYIIVKMQTVKPINLREIMNSAGLSLDCIIEVIHNRNDDRIEELSQIMIDEYRRGRLNAILTVLLDPRTKNKNQLIVTLLSCEPRHDTSTFTAIILSELDRTTALVNCGNFRKRPIAQLIEMYPNAIDEIMQHANTHNYIIEGILESKRVFVASHQLLIAATSYSVGTFETIYKARSDDIDIDQVIEYAIATDRDQNVELIIKLSNITVTNELLKIALENSSYRCIVMLSQDYNCKIDFNLDDIYLHCTERTLQWILKSTDIPPYLHVLESAVQSDIWRLRYIAEAYRGDVDATLAMKIIRRKITIFRNFICSRTTGDLTDIVRVIVGTVDSISTDALFHHHDVSLHHDVIDETLFASKSFKKSQPAKFIKVLKKHSIALTRSCVYIDDPSYFNTITMTYVKQVKLGLSTWPMHVRLCIIEQMCKWIPSRFKPSPHALTKYLT